MAEALTNLGAELTLGIYTLTLVCTVGVLFAVWGVQIFITTEIPRRRILGAAMYSVAMVIVGGFMIASFF